MSFVSLIGFLNLMNNLVLRVIVIHLNAINLYFLVPRVSLRITIFMHQFSLINQFGFLLHVNAIEKEPKFAMTQLVIIEMSACYYHK